MIQHIIRIGPDLIRIPLLCLVFPFSILVYFVEAALPVCVGGHPNKSRLFEAGFYALPIALFWAGWYGDFVP